MTMILMVAALLAVVALYPLVRPLLRASPPDRLAEEAHVRVLREQLDEVERGRSAGEVDEGEYGEARREIASRIHDERSQAVALRFDAPERRWAAALLTVMVIGALSVYAHLGGAAAVVAHLEREGVPGESELDMLDLRSTSEQLERQLKSNPQDDRGWAMLGRVYREMGNTAASMKAFDAAVKARPDNAELRAEYAKAVVLSQGGRLDGEVPSLVQQALAIDPDNRSALALAGAAALSRHEFQAAAEHLGRLQSLVPADSDVSRQLAAMVERAREKAGNQGAGAADAVPRASDPKPGRAGLTVSIRLTEAARSQIRAGDVLYVFARAADGERMPLAANRVPARAEQEHYELSLSDAQALTPDRRLSAARSVIVGAKLARGGDAASTVGALEVHSRPTEPGGELELVLGASR